MSPKQFEQWLKHARPGERIVYAVAEALARRIEKYWAAKGKKVTARVEQQSAGIGKGNRLWVVRSDLTLVD